MGTSFTQAEIGMSAFRKNVPRVLDRVRIDRMVMVLTDYNRPMVALVPVEVAEAIEEAGGTEVAISLLRSKKATS